MSESSQDRPVDREWIQFDAPPSGQEGFLLVGSLFSYASIPSPGMDLASTSTPSSSTASTAGNSASSSSPSSKSSIASSGISNPTDVLIIISNATGVAAEVYRAFAEFLVTKGQEVYQKNVSVVTWDYRATGRSDLGGVSMGSSAEPIKTSAKQNPDGSKQKKTHGKEKTAEYKKKWIALTNKQRISYKTWMDDLTLILDYCKKRFPDCHIKNNIVHVGHSIGGHILPALKNSHDVVGRAISMSAQSAYYGFSKSKWEQMIGGGSLSSTAQPASSTAQSAEEAKPLTVNEAKPSTTEEAKALAHKKTQAAYKNASRERQYLNWKVLLPLLCWKSGYLDGKLMGLGRDMMPRYCIAGDRNSWSSWSLTPGYLCDKNYYPEHYYNYQNFEKPLLSIFAIDDEFIRVGLEKVEEEIAKRKQEDIRKWKQEDIAKRKQESCHQKQTKQEPLAYSNHSKPSSFTDSTHSNKPDRNASDSSESSISISSISFYPMPQSLVPPETMSVNEPMGSYGMGKVQFLALVPNERSQGIGHNGWLQQRNKMAIPLWQETILRYAVTGKSLCDDYESHGQGSNAGQGLNTGKASNTGKGSNATRYKSRL
eukprot:TRINITY_DN32081_c0_g1_i1.p1 TRINITY_DN32081_c0_g1~~TRINITY_DN32081_c0_g1_i1.p1  ORF type:complete len:644 (-),score=26.19 TRINITY_DN32081_c0_g1_i1:198-1985(-)